MIHDHGGFVQLGTLSRARACVLVIFSLVTLLPLVGCGAVQPYEREHAAMGTRFRILLYAKSERRANLAYRAAFARIDAIDQACSDYDPKSELLRLCAAAAPGSPQPVSLDLWEVLAESQVIARASDGAFDVTVGPLSRLWRRAGRRGIAPLPEHVSDARNAVGFALLGLDARTQTVTFARPRMRLDLGGIAKGYAADQALAVLREHGVPCAVVDAGGDLALGEPPPETHSLGWRIGLPRAPGEDSPPASSWSLISPEWTDARPCVRLARGAVASSGDSGRTLLLGGQRYSHIVDPRSGEPLSNAPTVTVVAPTASLADALASTLSVLGPEEGLVLLEQFPGTSARFLVRKRPETRQSEIPLSRLGGTLGLRSGPEEDELQVVTSPGFPALDEPQAP